ncbi:MAG: oligopeptidase PepB [candidate division Zixibacteria bacterium SM23_73_3]|nr:MAG: oligopeptidase PepB [candidate division Zixibacteria bacterium SM23_73_3]
MFVFGSASGQSQVKKIPQRSEIPDKYKWRLEDIYPTDELWEEDFARVKALLPEMDKFKGHLVESGKVILDCLVMQDSIWMIFDPMYVYAYMKLDEDTRVSKYQEMSDRSGSMLSEVRAAFSFIDPEILGIRQEKLDELVKGEKGLGLYRHYIDNILRNREHTLSVEEEELLAQAGTIARVPRTVFTMIDDADVKFGSIRDERGDEVQLTKQRYSRFLESSDRRVRKDAMDTYNQAWLGYINTLGSTLAGSIKKDMFYARARKYNSTLEQALHANNIPQEVFNNLIETVSNNLEPIHRYNSLRKKYLDLDELHKYDLWVPLVPEARMEIPYDSAVAIILKATKPLGKQYVRDMQAGFNSGWVDVYETEGKGSGAYSWGAYGTHPYMLLNYNNMLDNIFTVAHEMGHNMHRFMRHGVQPYVYSGASIFVAEVASVTNEMLLMDYLLKHAKNKAEKLYLLNYYIEMIQGTFYTQVMFSEFERDAHARAEAGEALSASSLRQIYRNIYQKYNGPDLVVDSLDDLSCLRISHFYRNFYVYQYATSLAAASAFSQKILAGDKEALTRYNEMLQAGDSDYPIELLKKAGVDMTYPEPVNATVELFADLVEQFEKLLLE